MHLEFWPNPSKQSGRPTSIDMRATRWIMNACCNATIASNIHIFRLIGNFSLVACRLPPVPSAPHLPPSVEHSRWWLNFWSAENRFSNPWSFSICLRCSSLGNVNESKSRKKQQKKNETKLFVSKYYDESIPNGISEHDSFAFFQRKN